MPAPTISALPTPPSRADDPTNFSTKADAFLGALPTFQSEANAQASYLDGLSVTVDADAVAAAASAVDAANSATIAAGAANYKGDYSAGTTYQIGQSVSYLGARYTAKTVNTGVTPVDGVNWLLIPQGDVTLAGTQTLTNKTINYANNTLTGVVGLTATQTLTNKTIDIASNTLTGVAGITTTQTLTNKRITQRVVAAGTTTGTIAPTGDTADIFTLLGLTGAVVVDVPTGTPTNGQKLMLRIKDNGTARALSWNAIFRAIGTALPTTTVINKLIYVGCIYNTTDTKWDVVAVTQEA